MYQCVNCKKSLDPKEKTIFVDSESKCGKSLLFLCESCGKNEQILKTITGKIDDILKEK
jgi:predicted RNA-binding Zn-ribbon protein involved in translation (DUF1610 family)